MLKGRTKKYEKENMTERQKKEIPNHRIRTDRESVCVCVFDNLNAT